MKPAGLVAALIVAASVATGCSSSPTCDDVPHLSAQLDRMNPDDPDYNDTVEDLKVAQADCNA